jgi:nucleotide-binding universal stress UspA family protein
MKRAVVIAVVAAALAIPILSGAADDLPADEVSYEAQKEMWQARFRAAREAVATQRVRHREALDVYTQMRHRRRERGEEKQRILEELTASEVALEASEDVLEELFEKARRAGVPPGWTRTEHGDSSAAPEPTSDDEEVLP